MRQLRLARPGALAALILAAFVGVPGQSALAAGKEDLDALRARIERLKNDIAGAEEARTEAREELRDSERAISESNRALHNLEENRDASRAELKALSERANATQAEIASRGERLARMLTALYLNGDASQLKLALSGENPSRTARDLHYLTYISRAQARFVQSLRADLARLHDLEEETRVKSAELAAIEAEQRAAREQLMRERAERSKVYARVSQRIRDQRRQVKNLERDETRLSRLVEELAKVIAGTPAPRGRRIDRIPEAGTAELEFERLKGKLRLPTKGILANRYGVPRSDGGPAWKGLFIRAAGGQEVRSVAAGRVVFSEWLRGFGNLLIIDHGQAYLTIYGNNESILKTVGDEVRTGDVVATVGASGGNPETGLYFEIRHEGHAFDPLKWVSLK